MLQPFQIKKQIEELQDMLEFAKTQTKLDLLPITLTHMKHNDRKYLKPEMAIDDYIQSLLVQIEVNKKMLDHIEARQYNER